MNVLDWLLEDDVPGVQYLTRARLLGESPRSRRMATLRRKCNHYPPVARMLECVEECIAKGPHRGNGQEFRGNYHKYCGAFWTLMFLAEMYADGRDPRARKLAKHVLGTQLDNGGFSASGTPRYEIICLTANMLRALVHLGFGDEEAVGHGYRRLAERILPQGGVPCVVLETCLHTSCKMTLPQTLRCLAVAPKSLPRKKLKDMRDVLVKQMLDVRVFHYRRPDVTAYREAVRRRPQGITEREVRATWIKKHKVPDDQLLPKPGWLRFGFPRSYNPDLLEGMLALAELGAKHDPALDDALDHIERKRGTDGLWKLDDSLNGKMLADIERKGKPSKWITLRATTVLSHFKRIVI
ncbi:MAG: hypothetical protein ACE5FA_10325 [Dehalococcoidia bacterium]